MINSMYNAKQQIIKNNEEHIILDAHFSQKANEQSFSFNDNDISLVNKSQRHINQMQSKSEFYSQSQNIEVNSNNNINPQHSPTRKIVHYNSQINARINSPNINSVPNQVQEITNTKNIKSLLIPIKVRQACSRLLALIPIRKYYCLKEKHQTYFKDKTIFWNFKLKKDGININDKKQNGNQSSISYSQMHLDEEDDKNNLINLIKNQGFCYKFLLNQQNNCFWKLISKYASSVPLIAPDNQLKVLWDCIIMINIVIACIYITFTFAFYPDEQTRFNENYFTVLLIFFWVDLIFSLNTSYYNQGQLETHRIEIVHNYLSNQFKYDAVVLFAISLSLIFQMEQLSYILLFTFLKIGQFFTLFKKIREKFYQHKKMNNIFQLVELLLTIIFIAHLIACIWIFVGLIQYKQSSSNINDEYKKIWISSKLGNDLQGVQNIQIYLYAFYFSTVTMITVGYGDIVPSNEQEILVSLFTMFISCGVFAYSINQIGLIFQEINKDKNYVKEILLTINNYMNKKKINTTLQTQVREYLEYYCKEELTNNSERETQIIDMLSTQLKNNLMIDANKIILKDSPIFSKNFSQDFISQCVNLIQEVRYTPGQKILDEDSLDDNSIYFVEKGSVQLYIGEHASNKAIDNYISLGILKEGDSFGEYGFFTNEPRKQSAKSIGFTTLLKIKRDDFLSLIVFYELDYEKFCMIKDQIQLHKNFSPLNTKCFSCNKKTHYIKTCPLIHFQVNFDKTIKLSQKSYYQQRKKIERSKITSQTMRNLKAIQQIQIQFKSDHEGTLLDMQSDVNEESQHYLQLLSQISSDQHQQDQIEVSPKSNHQIEINEQQCNFHDQILNSQNSQLKEQCTDIIQSQKQISQNILDISNQQQQSQQLYKQNSLENQKYMEDNKDGSIADNYFQNSSNKLLQYNISNSVHAIEKAEQIQVRQKIEKNNIFQLQSSLSNTSRLRPECSINDIKDINQIQYSKMETHHSNNDLEKMETLLLFNQQKEKKDIYEEFDSFRNFDIYFVHNNLQVIILKLNKYRKSLSKFQLNEPKELDNKTQIRKKNITYFKQPITEEIMSARYSPNKRGGTLFGKSIRQSPFANQVTHNY